MNPKTTWYTSSSGSGLSATIGGFSVVGAAQGLSFLLGLFGHPVSQDAISAGLATLVTAAGALIAAYGVLRKVFFWGKAIFVKTTA